LDEVDFIGLGKIQSYHAGNSILAAGNSAFRIHKVVPHQIIQWESIDGLLTPLL